MRHRNIQLIVAGFLLTLLSSFGQTFFIALFNREIRAEFGLSHGEFGSMYSLATLASGLVMLWLGAMLDRVSLRRYAAAAAATLAGACMLLATVESPYLLVLALFGLRLAGQGMMSHAALSGMARAFAQHRGKAIAAATLGHPVGEAVLPITAVTAAAVLGWRHLWLGAALVLIVALVVLVKLLSQGGLSDVARPGSPADPARAGSATRADMLRDLRFYLLAPALIGPSFVVTGLFFHQVQLTAVKGWDLSWFASCFAAYAAASTAGLTLAGMLIDRVGAVRLMPMHLLPLCLACAILGQGSHGLVAVAFMGFAGTTMGAATPVITAMWAELYGVQHLGAIRALAASMMVGASALAPASMGWLIDASISIDALALGSAAYLAGASLLMVAALLRPTLSKRA